MNKQSVPLRLTLLAGLGLVFFGAFLSLQLKRNPSADVSTAVLVWWAALCGVSVFNFGTWALIRSARDCDAGKLQNWQRWLSLVFVLGCGFRSFLPRADVQRICLVDHWLSNVLVGRSVATVAELCFVTQWVLILREYADHLGSRTTNSIFILILPFIAVAEICSWYAVVTTAYIGNVIEQSIWVLTASMAGVGAISLLPRGSAADRRRFGGALVFAIGFIVFMCTVDVPMYLSRWQGDESMGRLYLPLNQGLQDLASRRVVTYAWEDWRDELAWMALYFSAAVWGSIAMIHVPRPSGSRFRSDGAD